MSGEIMSGNGSIEGNDAQASQEAPLTVGERLANLEKALSSLDTLFTGLQGGVILFEKRIDQFEKRITERDRAIEGCLSSEGAEPIIADISRRLRDIEAKFSGLEVKFEAAMHENRELQSVKVELAKFKVAMAAFSNHIHLPDGRLGMPFTLKGG